MLCAHAAEASQLRAVNGWEVAYTASRPSLVGGNDALPQQFISCKLVHGLDSRTNRGVCRKLAMARLMGARRHNAADVCAFERRTCRQVVCIQEPGASILETSQSAAYSSFHRKKTYKESGERRFHAQRPNLHLCGVELSKPSLPLADSEMLRGSAPRTPKSKAGNLLGEGSWAYV